MDIKTNSEVLFYNRYRPYYFLTNAYPINNCLASIGEKVTAFKLKRYNIWNKKLHSSHDFIALYIIHLLKVTYEETEMKFKTAKSQYIMNQNGSFKGTVLS